MGPKSSRRRFTEYRNNLKRNQSRSPTENGDVDARPESTKTRSTGRLFVEFLKLLKGERRPLVFALATLTLATLVRLGPPLATKIVIDNVLTNRPLPAGVVERLH